MSSMPSFLKVNPSNISGDNAFAGLIDVESAIADRILSQNLQTQQIGAEMQMQQEALAAQKAEAEAARQAESSAMQQEQQFAAQQAEIARKAAEEEAVRRHAREKELREYENILKLKLDEERRKRDRELAEEKFEREMVRREGPDWKKNRENTSAKPSDKPSTDPSARPSTDPEGDKGEDPASMDYDSNSPRWEKLYSRPRTKRFKEIEEEINEVKILNAGYAILNSTLDEAVSDEQLYRSLTGVTNITSEMASQLGVFQGLLTEMIQGRGVGSVNSRVRETLQQEGSAGFIDENIHSAATWLGELLGDGTKPSADLKNQRYDNAVKKRAQALYKTGQFSTLEEAEVQAVNEVRREIERYDENRMERLTLPDEIAAAFGVQEQDKEIFARFMAGTMDGQTTDEELKGMLAQLNESSPGTKELLGLWMKSLEDTLLHSDDVMRDQKLGADASQDPQASKFSDEAQLGQVLNASKVEDYILRLRGLGIEASELADGMPAHLDSAAKMAVSWRTGLTPQDVHKLAVAANEDRLSEEMLEYPKLLEYSSTNPEAFDALVEFLETNFTADSQTLHDTVRTGKNFDLPDDWDEFKDLNYNLNEERKFREENALDDMTQLDPLDFLE